MVLAERRSLLSLPPQRPSVGYVRQEGLAWLVFGVDALLDDVDTACARLYYLFQVRVHFVLSSDGFVESLELLDVTACVCVLYSDVQILTLGQVIVHDYFTSSYCVLEFLKLSEVTVFACVSCPAMSGF